MATIEDRAARAEVGDGKLEEGTALCLSGGGFRAMLFHVGVLWRLHESGTLPTLDRVSSVSGGSITAGVLGHRWAELAASGFALDAFVELVVDPIRRLAEHNIDLPAITKGAVLPFATIGEFIAHAYDDHLFKKATLQDLPDKPKFVINATNVQSGVLARFSKSYLRDYRVGEVKNPTVPLAVAVAASSAFPPFLSPVVLDLPQGEVTPGSGDDLCLEPFTTTWVLSDGGVYDNLGLETAIKRFRTLLVSDAGAKIPPEESPSHDWARHSKRVLDIVDNQVRSLRKRMLMGAYESSDPDAKRYGTYWSIRDDIAKYASPARFDVTPSRSTELASVPTRLTSLSPQLQERLINWGYAVSDAALRAHWKPDLPAAVDLPYPGSPI